MEPRRVSELIAAAVPSRDSYEIDRWPVMKPPMSMNLASVPPAGHLNRVVFPTSTAHRRGPIVAER